MLDWGDGAYERTAAQLAPVAATVVAAAGIRAGDRVVDVGCGTGNAALAAARAGGGVIGVDPAARLLEVARRRAEADGLDVAFAPGDGAALPLDDGEADAALSVFAVIFAPDARAVAAELARVLRPGGRAVLTSWLPAGAIHEAVGAGLARLPSAPPRPSDLDWGDAGAVRSLLEEHGFRVEQAEHELVFEAPSAAALVDEWLEHNPAWRALAAGLRAAGSLDAARAEMVAAAARHDAGGAAGYATRSPWLLTVATSG